MSTSKETTRWRATGSYLPTLASKTSLIEETRQFLLTYERVRDIETTRQMLVNGGLPQRSRATRVTIVKIVHMRLTRWHPPTWVLDDMITFAQDGHQAELRVAMLLHTARQDNLLYDFIQQVVVSRWFAGERELIRADVQRFLDSMQSAHPEVDNWSHSTRKSYPGTCSLPCVILDSFRVQYPSRLLSQLFPLLSSGTSYTCFKQKVPRQSK